MKIKVIIKTQAPMVFSKAEIFAKIIKNSTTIDKAVFQLKKKV